MSKRRCGLGWTTVGVIAVLMVVGAAYGQVNEGTEKYAPPEKSALPPSDMRLNLARTGLLITDPQIDFLSPKGVTWGIVGDSVTEQRTVPNIGRLMEAAKQAGIDVFISPHYYFPTDKGWKFEG